MEIISPTCAKQTRPTYEEMPKSTQNQYINVSQQDLGIQFEDNELEDKHYEPSIYLKIFFSYLYFTQGLIISLCSTMPYIYPQLPTYDVMAVFNASMLPFSFKFLIAPLIEKFTFFNYGKRKFWIVISQILTSVCLFISAFLTDVNQSYRMAVVLLVSVFFLTLQDISLDSLANKQLRHAHITSSVSVTSQVTGIIIGSMFLLKLTSEQFSKDLGLKEPISSASTIIIVLSLLVFVPSIFIHFYFRQTRLRREYESIQNPLDEIFCSYRAFFKWKSKYFRTVLLLLVMNQGFNFFGAGYDYELVQAGFSRNTSNTIQNIISIPINIIACYATSKIEGFGLKRGLILGIMIQLVICCYLRIVFPLDVANYVITSFVSGLFSMWTFMITTIFGYELPIHRYTGMFLTVVMSASNLGNSLAIHTKILAMSSWWTMSWVGIGLQFILAIFIYFFMYDWKDEGIIDLDQILGDSSSESSSEPSNARQFKEFQGKHKKEFCQ